MNLIPCPDCDKMISPNAETCPKCGRKLQPGDVNRGLQQNRQNQKGCLIALGIIVFLIIACLIFGSMQKGKAVYHDGQWWIEEE